MLPPAHVLLVEDDPATLYTTKRTLGRSGDVAAITVAVDGRDALDRLRSGELDDQRVVVLTDLAMPRMTGLELISAIRAEPALRELPILVLTASSGDGDRAAACALHVAGYFGKASAGLQQALAWLARSRATG